MNLNIFPDTYISDLDTLERKLVLRLNDKYDMSKDNQVKRALDEYNTISKLMNKLHHELYPSYFKSTREDTIMNDIATGRETELNITYITEPYNKMLKECLYDNDIERCKLLQEQLPTKTCTSLKGDQVQMYCDIHPLRPFVCKGDDVHKETIEYILANGFKDENPRPHYADGTPAHTIAISNVMACFDIENGESPLITLRPIAWKSAIKEMLWIWQDQSNDLNLLRDKYGITWWDNWALPDRTIGACYGETVRRHNLIHGLLDDIKNNPYGRRHIASLWQEDDFKEPHALKPCAFMTMHTVRAGRNDPNKKVLDTTLIIRSSDFVTAGVINMFQYTALQAMIARHCGLEPGLFTCFMQNVHIYDRHIEAAKELVARSIIPCRPKLTINPDKTDFFSITIDDFTLEDYPIDKIKERNPQMTIFRDEIAI